MPRVIHKLTAVQVAGIKAPKLYADGGGLYLRVTASGSKSWIFRSASAGKTRDMGLGCMPPVSLARARRLAAECQELRSKGIDPIEHRRQIRREAEISARPPMTFRACADAFIEAHEPGWRNPKHRQQWRNTLTSYAYPIVGSVPVNEVTTDLVLRALQQPVETKSGDVRPLWLARSETAGRLRGRIESILDWARARGLCQGEDPARWRGHLASLLPARSKVRGVRHHPALPYREIPAFMAKLRAQDGVVARALEFLILAAARTGEVVGAKFDEVDVEAKLWIVPAERMKAGREHRVPLCDRALEIVSELAEVRQSEFIFPGRKPARPISVLSTLLKKLRPGVKVHGFRSSFRDWVAECTPTPNIVAEAALAHAIKDKVEGAYRRGDLLEKRRQLMDDWAAYCLAEPAAQSCIVDLD